MLLDTDKRLPYTNQIFKYIHAQMALPKKNFKCVVFVIKYC